MIVKDRRTLTGKIGKMFIVLGFHSLQSKHATSQCKGRIQTSWRTSTKILDWNSYFKVDFLHRFYRWIISLTNYMIASLLSLLHRLSCMNILCSLRERGGLKSNLIKISPFISLSVCFCRSWKDLTQPRSRHVLVTLWPVIDWLIRRSLVNASVQWGSECYWVCCIDYYKIHTIIG